jgi:hypothetical protein
MVTWEPSDEEVNCTLAMMESQPLLDAATAYEQKMKEDRQVEIAFLVFKFALGILAVALLLHMGSCIGDVIDHMGQMPQ